MEKLSYFLPLIVPIYYKLPLEYFVAYTLFIMSNYSLNHKKSSRCYKLFQYECFIFLYSLYVFHSIIPSYILTCFSMFDYEWTRGIIFRMSIFLFSYFINYNKNPILFYPFIYLVFVTPSSITGYENEYKKMNVIQYNIMQTLFFFLCNQPTHTTIF